MATAVFVYTRVKDLSYKPWLHRFAFLTVLATLGLVGMGGLVTSHGVGMAVPDWPTSYGYNMFALPISTWLTGGIFHEHTHRLWASFVGVLVVALTRWMGGGKSRWPLILVGAGEILIGVALLKLGADWKGAGHFLAGIGGVVLLAGLPLLGWAAFWLVKLHGLLGGSRVVKDAPAPGRLPQLGWAKFRLVQLQGLLGGLRVVLDAPAPGRLPLLGWAAFWLVQLQGLLGGLRVVLDAQLVGNVRLGTAFGIFHGCLGQFFLVLLATIALLTSKWWRTRSVQAGVQDEGIARLHRQILVTTGLVFLQLVIGATMRHQHAGLAIHDFPLAYGKLWPATDAVSLASYNAQRSELAGENSITAFQIVLQMAHRGMAVVILLCVGAVAWRAKHRLMWTWLVLILIQAALGVWTIWSNKAADVATAHVLVGALSLVTGVLASVISFAGFSRKTENSVASNSELLRRETSISAVSNP